MKPGPDYIYKCPNCSKLVKRRSLATGNTFGAKFFSDGRREAPMLPDFPKLTKCKSCNTILDLSALKDVGTFDNDFHYDFDKKEVVNRNNGIKWKNIFSKLIKATTKIEDIPSANFLESEDLFRALKLFPQHELYIRQKIWWSYNRYRLGKNVVYDDNCKALIKLLDENDEQQKIMIAELYRNLGEFEKCVELMYSLPDIRYSDLKWIFEKECKKGNSLTFCIDFDNIKTNRDKEEREKIGEEEWLRKQQQMERERIHIANAKKDIAMLWKNGVAQSLTDGKNEEAMACSVFVSGNDVYVAGYERYKQTDGHIKSVAMLWKNGISQNIENEENKYAVANSVFVSSNDVYVVGYKYEDNPFRCVVLVWKNGILQNLIDKNYDAKANSVFVSDNDVYVTGENFKKTLWKNGVLQKLTGKKELANTTSVYVLGDDVYVAGQEYNRNENCDALLWKNGIPQNLTNGNHDSYANSVYVAGTDVYVAGFVRGNKGQYVAVLWKNDIAHYLSDGYDEAKAHSVFVSGNDVYVAGTEGSYHHSVAKLWKNGVAQDLTDGNHKAEAHSVYVSGNDVYVVGKGYEY